MEEVKFSLVHVLHERFTKLFGVETRSLIQALKINIEMFPSDFAFQLDQNEFVSLRSQIVISKGKGVMLVLKQLQSGYLSEFASQIVILATDLITLRTNFLIHKITLEL